MSMNRASMSQLHLAGSFAEFALVIADLEKLALGGNQIGDAGVSALASACASGALDHIKDLYLNSNPISKQAQDTMRAAAAARGVNVHI